MPPATIIPAFDPFKYGKLSLLLVYEVLVVNPFYFDCLEEAFSQSIIPAISFSAHTLGNQLICLSDFSKIITCILSSSIRVEYQFPGNRPVPYGHDPGRNDSLFSRKALTHRPTNYFAVIKVNNHR